MSWHRPLTDMLPPVGSATAKRLAGTHLLAVAATTFVLWWPVVHGDLGLGGLAILFSWWALASLHVRSAISGTGGRLAGGTSALAASLAAGCGIGWVGLPVLVAVLVGSLVSVGIGWRTSAYPTAVAAAVAALVVVTQLAPAQASIVVALVVGLAAFLVLRRGLEVPRRRGLRALASTTGGTIVTLLGVAIVTMAVASNALTDADVGTDVTSLVTSNFTEPRTIGAVSTFRSLFGHTYADSTHSTSSMKHYLHPLGEASSTPSYAPFDGEAFQLLGSGGSGGYDLWVRPVSQPNVSVQFFHIQPTDDLAAHFGIEGGGFDPVANIKVMLGMPATSHPFPVTAGDLLGTEAGDIALAVTDWADPLPFFCTEPLAWWTGWFSPVCARQTRLVSVFEAMTPGVADEWEAWGLTAGDVIVTEEERVRYATFDAGLNPIFRPLGEEEQLEVLRSLDLPVIEGSSSGVDVEFPVGGALLAYSTEGIRGQTADGRGVAGFEGAPDGVISPLYPQAPDDASGSTFTLRLSGEGNWQVVVVPPGEINRAVRPLASLLTSSGRYVTRTSGR